MLVSSKKHKELEKKVNTDNLELNTIKEEISVFKKETDKKIEAFLLKSMELTGDLVKRKLEEINTNLTRKYDDVVKDTNEKFENYQSKNDNELKEFETKLDHNVEFTLKKLENDIEKRLIAFHKEITDKCFTSMENIMRYTKEVSLIEKLAQQMKEEDFINLQTALLQPVIDTRIKVGKDKRGTKISNSFAEKGKKVIAERARLHKEFLDMQKKGHDTADIQAKLFAYDDIIKKLEE